MSEIESPVKSLTVQRLILVSVAVMLLLGSLDQTIVSTALPTIVADLGGLDHLSWVVTAYLLASTVVAPIYGKLGDLYGRRNMMLASVTIFLVGSVMCGLSTSMMMLIISRAVQGLGGGGLFVLALTVIGDVVPPRQRGKVQGIFGSIFAFSSIAGPLLGGYFVEHLTWHWIFFINLPLGILSLVIFLYAFEPRMNRTKHKVDYIGAALLSVAVGTIVLFTSLGGREFEWASATSFGLVALIVASVIAFIFVERKAQEPILPLQLFSHPTFTIFSTIGFIVGAAMFGALTFLPLYLQVVQGVSPTDSGLRLMPLMLGIVTGSMFSGRFMSRTGHYKILPVTGTAVMSVGLLWLTTLAIDTSATQLVVMMFLVGIGMGPTMSVSTTAIQNAIPREIIGVGTAGFTLFRQIGGSLGVSLFGALFANRLHDGMAGIGAGADIDPMGINADMMAALPADVQTKIGEAVTMAMHPIFLFSAIAAIIAFIVATRIKEIPLNTKIEPVMAE